MLRLIRIFGLNERDAYVDPAGVCYELDGTIITGGFDYITLDNNPEQPGWYTPPIPPVPVNNNHRRVTKLAFRNRFTTNEKIGIELASAHNPGASMQMQQFAAALRANLADQRDAKYIDLDRLDTRNGVLGLVSVGLLSGPDRAAQILDADIQDHERYTEDA